MRQKRTCYDCGEELERLRYFMPAVLPDLTREEQAERPLCGKCWEAEVRKRGWDPEV